MKRTLFGLATVVLALGLVLAGCAGPFADVGNASAKSRDIVGGFDTAKIYTADRNVISSAGDLYAIAGYDVGRQLIVEFSLKDPASGEIVATAFCGNSDIPNGSYYKITALSPASLYGSVIGAKLEAALTYVANNYSDMAANNPAMYTILVQSVIWNITNGNVLQGIEGTYSGIKDTDGSTVAAFNDVMANYDKIAADYDTGVTIQGTADANGNLYGPFNVSVNSLFPNMLYDLTMTKGDAAFVDADGNGITQALAGVPFYVQVADGASGDFNFTATASASKDYQVVDNFLVWIEAYTDAPKVVTDPSYQPLFQPLFQPLVSTTTQSYLYSCGGSFNIAPNTPLTPQGSITIQKTVGDINIAAWAAGKGTDYINSLISFQLSLNGVKIGSPVGVDSNGMINFSGLADGTYTVTEVLSQAGALVFQQVVPVTITVTGGKAVSADGFDASATFESVIPYQGADNVTVRVNLADGLVYNSSWNGTITNSFDNPYFEDFHVKAADGSSYSSYCAAWYSDNLNSGLINYDRFAGAKGAADKANIIQALNYIIANWGSLDQWPVGPGANTATIPQNATKLISQMVVYKLLDDGVTSTEVLGAQAWVNEYVDQVLAEYSTFNGPSAVADVAFMAKINFIVGQQNMNQPQLVPIYSSVINNTVLPPAPPALGPSQSSVTATNAGNAALVTFDKKNNPINDFIVPNSNHFVFATFTRDQLLAGQALDFVVGNNITKVGSGFVQLVGNNLVITIDGKGSYGALAFNKVPAPKNGNIQSVTKAADAAAFGALAGFSFNSQGTIPCPSGSPIYLYIDCDSFQFYPIK